MIPSRAGMDNNEPSVCHVKSCFRFEAIDGIILYNWDADFEGEGNVVG